MRGHCGGGAFQRVTVRRMFPLMPGRALPLATRIVPVSASSSPANRKARGARFGVRPSQPYLTRPPPSAPGVASRFSLAARYTERVSPPSIRMFCPVT